MNDEKFKEMCKSGLKKALEEKDGWLAHFYGKMLLPSFLISPSINRYPMKWTD